MITNEIAAEMTDAALHYARLDLNKVIQVQEKTGREYGYHLVPKLGAYWDELSAVVGEIKRRQAPRVQGRVS